MRTLVLLGAGASVDAGVPASTSMTAAIGKALVGAQDRYNGVDHAYNYAVGAMIAHKSAANADPYAGIDVEELFSAVQMLAEKETLEVAPFVQWSPALQGIGGANHVSAFFDQNLEKAILGGYGGSARRLIEDLVKAVVGTAESDAVFRLLEKRMLAALLDLVAVTPERVEYLKPLLDLDGGGRADIVTLNYDRSIAIAAETAGLTCDTGIGTWAGGHEWAWESDVAVRLLKLHGSIDWRIAERKGAADMPESYVFIDANPSTDATWAGPGNAPGVVFGSRGKVRARGPFLAMLRAFDELLAEADRLLVVGYSFRDDHVNVALSRWLNSRAPRDLHIIDLGFDATPAMGRPTTIRPCLATPRTDLTMSSND